MEQHGSRSTATRLELEQRPSTTCPVRVHSRGRMAIVTSPQPVTSAGPIRTTTTTGTTNRPVVSSGTLRRNISDFTTITIGQGVSPSPRSNAPPESVSLTIPRPETDRAANEYVEAPLRSINVPKTERTPVGEPRHHHDKVINTQPASSTTFKKHYETECLRQKDSIICSDCGRCMCASCRTPRSLPSKWLCGNSCYCSAESIVDYATCLCCIKALFYHCANDESGGTTCADDPCSCGPDQFYQRWGCLSLLAIPLPCLFCYWPCRALVNLCESCHQYLTSRGCRCQKVHQQTPTTPQKRLLDSPE